MTQRFALAPCAAAGQLRGAALASLSMLAACSFAPPPSVPEPVAEIPDAFAEPAAADGRMAREWWHGFEDPALNAVVDSVLASNFDLAEAVARVRQARAQAGVARSGLFPAVQGVASVSDQDTPSNAGIGQQLGELTGGGGGGGRRARHPVPGQARDHDLLPGRRVRVRARLLGPGPQRRRGGRARLSGLGVGL